MTPNYPACFVLVRKENKILFVLRAATGYMDGNYSLPAGRVEKGETYLMGACREAAEEVGLVLDPKQLRHIHTQHLYSKKASKPVWVNVYFDVLDWSGKPSNVEADKHSKIGWLPIDDLPANIMDFQRQALLEIAEGQSYSEFGWS